MASILICEDEHIVALDIKRHLERFGYSVVGTYASGEDAIEASGTLHPDLVLMDICLQGKLDGVEAARQIYDAYSIPVILLTAYADEDTVSRARDSRPFGYIIKPFEERELRTGIEIALYRHAMDLKLRQSEERYRNLFEKAPSANFTAAPDGLVLDCNGAFHQLMKCPDEEPPCTVNLVDFFQDRAVAAALLSGASTEAVVPDQEWVLLRRDGKPVHVIATIALLKDEGGKLLEIRGYLVDITERKELETQLRQAQKMEAIGRLAGGVAHDFNNIITAIMGYCNLLSEDIGQDPGMREELEGIQTAASKAVNLTRQLLAFSRKQALEPRVIDANATIHELEKMARRLVSENISLKFFFDARRPKISIDAGQFEQIVINLVVNAKDAVADDGSITVETGNLVSTGDSPRQGLPPGDWFSIVVRDNGSGIAPENLQRIFDPFFTTKGVDQGTGLGLSTVYAAVNQNGGRIFVDSELRKGTSFSIYFPVCLEKGAETAEKALPGAKPLPRGSGTILLAEDDDYLRGLLARILTKSGYKVLEAANPGEAILIAERERDYLLLTDVVMPRMSGYELATRLITMNKDLKVLFMSGYHDKREGTEGNLFRNSAFLQKPFTHEQLMEALKLLV